MCRRRHRRDNNGHCWNGVILGLVIVVNAGLIRALPKPVPDTKGMEFIFATPLCSSSSPAMMYVIPQTTVTVNVSLVTFEESVSHSIPAGESLRVNIACEAYTWDEISNKAIIVTTNAEVSLYIEYEDSNHLVYPSNTLDLQYTVSSLLHNTHDESFLILLSNNATIDVMLPLNLTSHVTFNGQQFTSGSKINFNLSSHESVGLRCSCDLSGTIVSASQPISVLVGSRKSGTTLGVVEQLPPYNIWGRKFIFSGHSWIAENATLKIMVQNPSTGATIISKDSSSDIVFTDTSSVTMQVSIGDFIAIESNTSVLCLILYDVFDKSNARHTHLKFLTPMVLFHISSTFMSDIGAEVSANFLLTSKSYKYISFNQTSVADPFVRPMTFFWNIFICKSIPLVGPFAVHTSDSNVVPFYSNVLRRDTTYAYDYSLGMRITNIYDACVKTPRSYGGNGDGIDNDCDNRIDEERLNNVDDDGDHSTDEDISYHGVIQPSPADRAWQYLLESREVETGISASMISIIISSSVAVFAVICFIGIMLLVEKVRQTYSSTRVSPISGPFA